MEKQKVLFVLLALAGLFVFATGGVSELVGSGGESLTSYAVPLLNGSITDTAVFVVSVLLLVWALLPTGSAAQVGRTQLLQGIALGSALVVCGCLSVTMQVATAADPQVSGALALVATFQAAVGLAACGFLLSRPESRSAATTPVLANGGLAILLVFITNGSFFA